MSVCSTLGFLKVYVVLGASILVLSCSSCNCFLATSMILGNVWDDTKSSIDQSSKSNFGKVVANGLSYIITSKAESELFNI